MSDRGDLEYVQEQLNNSQMLGDNLSGKARNSGPMPSGAPRPPGLLTQANSLTIPYNSVTDNVSTSSK